MVKVSIILPVYNAADTVEKTIISVLNQTLKDIELIIIDDGSNIETKNVIRSFRDRRIKLIEQENSGVSNARNSGIRSAKGNYLFFIDSDDWIEKKLLEDMLIFLEKHSLDLVTARIVENNSTKLQEKVKVYRNFFTSDEAKIAQCEKVLFLQSSLAKLFVRKKIVENNIYFPVDMDLGEDLYFTYLYIDNVEKIGFVSTSSYIVENINGESLSKKYINNLESSLIEQGKLKAHFEAKHLQYAKEYYKTHVDFNFYQTTLFVSNLYKLGIDKNYMQKRKELRKFLDSHKEWWKITNPERYPKNLKDKIMYKVISSNNVTLILAFFMFKERLRRMKFSFGKK